VARVGTLLSCEIAGVATEEDTDVVGISKRNDGTSVMASGSASKMPNVEVNKR
jgi:hypothetical protein